MCIGKKKKKQTMTNKQPKSEKNIIVFSFVSVTVLHSYVSTHPDLHEGPFSDGHDKETICAKGSFPHVSIGLAVILVNRITGENS